MRTEAKRSKAESYKVKAAGNGSFSAYSHLSDLLAQVFLLCRFSVTDLGHGGSGDEEEKESQRPKSNL